MNREYNCKVSSKNSERLLKNLQNTLGDYFFLPHPVYLYLSIYLSIYQWSLNSTEVVGRTTLVDTVPTGYGRPRGDAGACPVDETVTFRPAAHGPGSVDGGGGRRVTLCHLLRACSTTSAKHRNTPK